MNDWAKERLETKEWLKNLKVGDEVAACSSAHGWSHCYNFFKVSRMTPTQIILGNTTKYRRKDGIRIGDDSYTRNVLVRPTDELKAQIATERRYLTAFNKFNNLTGDRNNKYTVEQLEAVIDILKPKPTFELNTDGTPVVIDTQAI